MERAIATRPFRDLLARLPMLPITSSHAVDFPAADAPLLIAIREDAEVTMQIFHRGLATIGDLISLAAPELEDGTHSSDSMECIGQLISALADGIAALVTLSAHCRHETSDWVGPKPTVPANSSWGQQ